MNNMENRFKDILKDLRTDRGLSMTILGKELGIGGHSQIGKWESGEVIPGMFSLIALAKFFNISIDELVGLKS